MKFRLFLLVCLFCACKKHVQDKPNEPPVSITLVSPARNELCVSGTVISASENTLTFKWEAVPQAESYEIVLTNSQKNDSTIVTSTKPEIAVTLRRSTPYTWSVLSYAAEHKLNGRSEKWAFYNAGPGASSYAPLPAEAVAPVNGQTVTLQRGTTTLSWKGSDPDGNIVSYEVYLGKTTALSTPLGNTTNDSFPDIPVSSGTQYYWKVITIDADNNRSESVIFQFYTK